MRTADTQRITAWLTLVAILFAALLPTLSHAIRPIAAVDIAHLNGICTSLGYVEAGPSIGNNDSPTSSQDDESAKLQHCPFCVKFSGDMLVVGHDNATAIHLGAYEGYPRLYFVAPRPLFIWAFAQPRAPPTAS